MNYFFFRLLCYLEPEAQQKMVRKQKEDILSMRGMLEELNQGLEACGSFTSHPVTQQARQQTQLKKYTSTSCLMAASAIIELNTIEVVVIHQGSLVLFQLSELSFSPL